MEFGEVKLSEKSTLERLFPTVQEYPFDSERKRMSILRKDGDIARLYTK